MTHHRFRMASPAIILVFAVLALVGLVFPNSARAGVVFNTSASSTAGFATNPGANCVGPNITPTASIFQCTDAAGDLQKAFAAAAPGVLKALATVTAIPCPSSAACLANVSASADSEDLNGLIFNSNFTGTITLNGFHVDFSANVSTTGFAGADALGRILLNGQQAIGCLDFADQCQIFPVDVPLNTPITLSMLLDVFAFGNAGFQPQIAQALADASDTFGFVPGAEVFDLPPGVTANDPDLFIFNNVFLPPDATAVPLPATLPLFATGLGALCLLGWRRQRKAHVANL